MSHLETPAVKALLEKVQQARRLCVQAVALDQLQRLDPHLRLRQRRRQHRLQSLPVDPWLAPVLHTF